MENNKICNWLLYYARQNSQIINSEDVIDIESSLRIKQMMCSSICYFDCGNILFHDFPAQSTGFIGIFDFLANDRGRVMDRINDDEQRSFIRKLTSYDNFSMRHHAMIVKCLMRSYVCQLAPYERIKRALDAFEVSNGVEEVAILGTYSYIQQTLTVWLKEAALRGLRRLCKSKKNPPELQESTIISTSTVGSLVAYAMVYYAQTKMTKYTVTLPEANLSLNNGTWRIDLALEHSKVVTTAFADICDNKDILPLQMDCLISRRVDSVPTTLTIALLFHWIFGNSLKNLENLLKMSTSITKSNIFEATYISPNNRPSHLPLNISATFPRESKTFFLNDNKKFNEGLRQIFAKGKEGGDIKNGSIKASANGDSSPEVFLTPTEDIPTSFTSSLTPPLKLLSFKSDKDVSLPTAKNTPIEPVQFSLKAEFQKKSQQKQNLVIMKPIINLATFKETTWMAQSTKDEITHIPLTPKKTSKSPKAVSSPTDSSQSLTKSQYNQLQVNLNLQRQKIENEKKNLSKQSEKSLENSKQKVFFQALNSRTKIIRRNSLELTKGSSNIETGEADRRLSMYITRAEKNEEVSAIKRFASKEKLQPFPELVIEDLSSPASNTTGHSPGLLNLESNDDKETESPQSLQASEVNLSPVEMCVEQVYEPVAENHSSPVNDREIPLYDLVDSVSLSRKNSSPSISSLSNSSNMSIEREVFVKDDYQKSIELLSTSLTSLQEEIRFLSKQQLSWDKKLSQSSDKVKFVHSPGHRENGDNTFPSENNSVAETPTNNVSSLTEVSEVPKMVIQTKSPTQLSSESPVPRGSSNEVSPTISPAVVNFYEESCAQNIVGCQIERDPSVSPSFEDLCPEISEDRRQSNETVDNDDVLPASPTGSPTEDDVVDMASSTESIIVPSAQPVAYVIAENEIDSEAIRKKAELLAKREQRRLLKLEMFRQRREQERENRISATNEELLDRELKKRLEQEKRDSLLKKYLDRKNENTPHIPSPERRSSSIAGTPVKSMSKSQTPRLHTRGIKQDSVENLSLGSPQRNGWFSSMRQNNRTTSSSTSKLNTTLVATDTPKFGVPLPPQEYMGPKLFGKRKVKTNRSVIANAISYCCLAGSVNVSFKDTVLKDLADAEGTHFMILFRDARCQYRSLYLFDLATEDLNLITGNGPKKVTHDMVEKFYKYNCGAKQFNQILSTKHLSTAVDAIVIQSLHWSARPPGQTLSGAVSTASIISQTKLKRVM